MQSKFSNDAPMAAVILAGGAGARMGGDKARRILAGKPLIGHVLDRLGRQCDPIALSGDQAHGTLPLLPDADVTRRGPLAGIVQALRWGQEKALSHVLCVPCDAPFLPDDLAGKLASTIGPADVCVAQSDGQAHPTIGLWSVACLDTLEQRLQSGALALMATLDALDTRFAAWENAPLDPFFNVNSPADLAIAEAMLRKGRMPLVLDMRGLKCPLPAIKTEKALAKLQEGEEMVVFCTDPMAQIDIPHCVARLSARLLAQDCSGETLHFCIERPAA